MVKRVFVSVSLADVHRARATLGSLAQRLTPGDVPLAEVGEMWEAFAAIERSAAAAKTLLAARVAEARRPPGGRGEPADEHLARKAGTSRGAARRVIETSRHLRKLPATEQALRRGELSQEQADTIADAAAANPDAEQSLLDTARTGSVRQLREAALRAKAAADPDPDATHRRIHRERCLRRHTGPDGAWQLHARGTADAGAMVNAALEPIIEDIFRRAWREGRRESREAYAFDALVALARGAIATPTHIPAPASDERGATATPEAGATIEPDARGDRGTARDTVQTAAGAPTPTGADPVAVTARRNRVTPSFLALLRIDLEALVRGRVEGDEVCEIAGVGPVPARVARTLLGDAVLKLVVTRGVDVVNVTSLGRGPTAAQRIALLWNTPACTNSECDHTFAIQHDHRVPWADDQLTELPNLDRLCPNPCHRRKTHDGWALVAGTGRRPLVPPDDPRHPANQSPAAHAPPITVNRPSVDRPELDDRLAADPDPPPGDHPRPAMPTLFGTDAA
jgi:Domain of unknown function (DUF222)